MKLQQDDKEMMVQLGTVEEVKEFCSLCCGTESDVFVNIGKYYVDGKSLLGLLSLDLTKPVHVTLLNRGDEAAKNLFDTFKKNGWEYSGYKKGIM